MVETGKFCFFSYCCKNPSTCDDKSILINPKIVHPTTKVHVEFKYVEPSQSVSNLKIKSKYKVALIGVPIYPRARSYYLYHNRIRYFENCSEDIGFINSNTQFEKYNKRSIDEIDDIKTDDHITQRIFKMAKHRQHIINKSLLIIGGEGAGKTYMIKFLNRNIKEARILNLLKVVSEFELQKTDYIDSVLSFNDGLLLIDDICILKSQLASYLSDYLISLLEKPILIIATSRLSPFELPFPLQTLFPSCLSINTLQASERRKIIESSCKSLSQDDVDFIIKETSGLSRGELGSICRIIPAINPFSQNGFVKIIKSIVTTEKPLQLRHVGSKPRVAGYQTEINEIRLILRIALGNDEKSRALLQYNGVFLHGPSGNGKSLLVRSLSEEFEVPFFVLEFDKIFSRYLGESERAIREVFASARFFSPCAIVIEDIDAIGGKRSDESGVGGRVLSTLLNEIDGVTKNGQVVLIATSNAYQLVDSALLRPGRFDRLIEIPNPSFEDRKSFFQMLREKTPVDTQITDDELAEKTKGFTCAEIQSFFRFSALQALKENKDVVTREYFEEGIVRVQERKQAFTQIV